MTRQPFLHDLTVTLAAPLQVWADHTGAITPSDVNGIYCGDTRIARAVTLDVSGPEGSYDVPWLSTNQRVGEEATFGHVIRIDDPGADPLVFLTRTRRVDGTGVREHLTFASAAARPVVLTVAITVEPDATSLNYIKHGDQPPADVDRDGASWHWDERASARVDFPDAEVSDGPELSAHWTFTVQPNTSHTVSWSVTASDDRLPFLASIEPPLAAPALAPGSPETLARLVQRSVADLSALRLRERDDPARTFFAAGAPWFLTLFGRDSLIASRLAGRVAPEMAIGTLRTLAARQGRVVDVNRAEAPGKILHEVRAQTLDLLQGTVLPPEYYGTIDATPLWVMTLADVADSRPEIVAELLDPLRGAAGWLLDHGDPDGDGFLEYFDESGHGLANQGWKDSGDSIRWADGRVAEGPIALAEVQGYAFAAVRAAADLLEQHGSDAELVVRLRERATLIQTRFRAQFWVSDALGAYPAIALDVHKRPVTGVASNMGHLLGLGLLDAAEERLVVSRLLDPTMFSGYGVRTMSNDNGVYWPLRYHVGSVWTHDNAMIIEGMLRSGFHAEARTLAEGLLRAAEGFNYLLPELFGGQPASEFYPPVPYPASCRPQAWAAASAVTIARALGALD